MSTEGSDKRRSGVYNQAQSTNENKGINVDQALRKFRIPKNDNENINAIKHLNEIIQICNTVKDLKRVTMSLGEEDFNLPLLLATEDLIKVRAAELNISKPPSLIQNINEAKCNLGLVERKKPTTEL